MFGDLPISVRLGDLISSFIFQSDIISDVLRTEPEFLD